jgi:hypothetical protein
MGIKDEWQRWLEENRERYIGGDIEHIENPEGCFRGPILSIEVEEEALVFVTEWTGHILVGAHNLPVGNWKAATTPDPTRFTYTFGDDDFPLLGRPQDIGSGRYHFRYPFSMVTLFPQGGSKLDRSRVQDL